MNIVSQNDLPKQIWQWHYRALQRNICQHNSQFTLGIRPMLPHITPALLMSNPNYWGGVPFSSATNSKVNGSQ